MSQGTKTKVVRLTPSTNLPPLEFGRLVGTFDHWTFSPHDGTRRNPNHIYLWINDGGKYYECAFNTESTDYSEVEFASFTEIQAADRLPADGFKAADFSYKDVDGLSESSFHEVDNGNLRALISQYAINSKKIAVYGVTYDTRDGIHDVHQNHGEPAGSQYPQRKNQDGALAFYSDEASGKLFVRWVFVKFQTQSFE